MFFDWCTAMMRFGVFGGTAVRGSFLAISFLVGSSLAGCAMEDIEGPSHRSKSKVPTSADDVTTGDGTGNGDDGTNTDTPEPPGTTDPDPNTPPPSEKPDEVPEGSFAVGVKLLTIGELNLRSGEGTSFDILTAIPAGKRVTVEKISGASGWVNVSYDGKTGFVSKEYVHEAKYSAERGGKMAARALALWDGKPSRDLCLAGVDDTAESAGAMPPGVSWIPRKPSAVDWQNYVNANPKELLKRGYAREDLDVNSIPKGSIIGWRAGQCGYHSLYGHIEVVADDNSSRACSDYCGAIKKTCGAPFIYVPIEL